MSFVELLLIAIALSMDAFAVSIAKGFSVSTKKLKYACITGFYFGLFQALMPTIGFFLGASFKTIIEKFDHWIAFGMLAFIGVNMIRESFQKEEEKESSDFSVTTMLALAIATSIDALIAGVSFAILHVKILQTVIVIGITTFLFSFVGLSLGSKLGDFCKKIAERIGGIILILLGFKVLLEHTGILAKIFS